MEFDRDDGYKILGTLFILVIFAAIVMAIFSGNNGASCPPEAVECDQSDCGCCIYDAGGNLIDYCDSGTCPSGYVLTQDGQCCNIDNLEECVSPSDACINPSACDLEHPCCEGYDCDSGECKPCEVGFVCDPNDVNSCCNNLACNSQGRCESLACDSMPCENPGEACQICDSEGDCQACSDNSVCTADLVCQAQGDCPEGYYSCSSCPSGCCDALSGGCFECVGAPCDAQDVGRLCEVCNGDNCGTCDDAKCVNTGSGYSCVSVNDGCPEGTHACDDCATGCCDDNTGSCLSCEGQTCSNAGDPCYYCVDENNCVECENTVCSSVDGNLQCVNSGDCPPGTVPNDECEEGCGLPDGTCPSECEGDECETGDVVYDDDNWTCIVDGEGTTVDLDDLQSGECEINSAETSTPIACTNGDEWQYFTVGEFNCFVSSGGQLPSWVFDLGPSEECLDCQKQCTTDATAYDLNGDEKLDSADVQLFLDICGGFTVEPDENTGTRVCVDSYDARIDFNDDGVNDEVDFECLNAVAESSCCHLFEESLACEKLENQQVSHVSDTCFKLDSEPYSNYKLEFDRLFGTNLLPVSNENLYTDLITSWKTLSCDVYCSPGYGTYLFDKPVDMYYKGCMTVQGSTYLFLNLYYSENVPMVKVNPRDCSAGNLILFSDIESRIPVIQVTSFKYRVQSSCESKFATDDSCNDDNGDYVYTLCINSYDTWYYMVDCTEPMYYQSKVNACSDFAHNLGCNNCNFDYDCDDLEECNSQINDMCSAIGDSFYQRCYDYFFTDPKPTPPFANCIPNDIYHAGNYGQAVIAFCGEMKDRMVEDCIQFSRDAYNTELEFGSLAPKYFVREFNRLMAQCWDEYSDYPDTAYDYGDVSCD